MDRSVDKRCIRGSSPIEIKRVWTKYTTTAGSIWMPGLQNVTVEFNIKTAKKYEPNSYVKIYLLNL